MRPGDERPRRGPAHQDERGRDSGICAVETRREALPIEWDTNAKSPCDDPRDTNWDQQEKQTETQFYPQVQHWKKRANAEEEIVGRAHPKIAMDAQHDLEEPGLGKPQDHHEQDRAGGPSSRA